MARRMANYWRNVERGERNPDMVALLGIVVRLGLVADASIVLVKGGLTLTVITRSTAIYDDLARALQQAGFSFSHHYTRRVYVRCAH